MTPEQERALEIITQWLRNTPDALDAGSTVTFTVFDWPERDKVLVNFARAENKRKMFI